MTEIMNLRRSWMVLPGHDSSELMRSMESKPDVAVLDLEYSVPPRCKELVRSDLKALGKSLGAAQAEIFVRIDRDTRWADAAAAVHRGVKGIVFPGPEDPDEVTDLAQLITTKERERGV